MTLYFSTTLPYFTVPVSSHAHVHVHVHVHVLNRDMVDGKRMTGWRQSRARTEILRLYALPALPILPLA